MPAAGVVTAVVGFGGPPASGDLPATGASVIADWRLPAVVALPPSFDVALSMVAAASCSGNLAGVAVSGGRAMLEGIAAGGGVGVTDGDTSRGGAAWIGTFVAGAVALASGIRDAACVSAGLLTAGVCGSSVFSVGVVSGSFPASDRTVGPAAAAAVATGDVAGLDGVDSDMGTASVAAGIAVVFVVAAGGAGVATGVDEAVDAGVTTGATLGGLACAVEVCGVSGNVVRAGAALGAGGASAAPLGAVRDVTGSTIGALTDPVDAGRGVGGALDAGGVVVAGETPVACVAPQSGQNFAAAAMSRPHDEHARAALLVAGGAAAAVMVEPHARQNRAPAGFSTLHAGHAGIGHLAALIVYI